MPCLRVSLLTDHGTAVLENKFEHYVTRVEPLLERYGYGVVAAAVMAEGVGIPTPEQTLLIAGALEAANGRINIMWLLFLVTAVAMVGNSFGYAIGRWGGRTVLCRGRHIMFSCFVSFDSQV
jgi:membrane protein DedA with SNARE-associated domain